MFMCISGMICYDHNVHKKKFNIYLADRCNVQLNFANRIMQTNPYAYAGYRTTQPEEAQH